MKKIAFIGAGSVVFTRSLVRDLMTFPAFQDATIALMDIDDEKLMYAAKSVEKIIGSGNYPAKVISTKSRIEALKDADGVVSTINIGDLDVWANDITIPKKYGVDINVGDTRGPAGIFRAMRTLPEMLAICKDIETYCPGAIFLNYTNPMAMLCRGMQGETKVNVTGLCTVYRERQKCWRSGSEPIWRILHILVPASTIRPFIWIINGRGRMHTL